ncbi:MAG: hypothetical protein EXQ93_06115 [Alphaproteobacteria bacterium]|nr:hypothetical protein [Alphaproteobacteria bacterium]
MSDERRRVLDMLSEGKINADEAERLLNALNGAARGEEPAAAGPFAGLHRMRRHLHRVHDVHHAGARYLHIVVDKDTPEGKSERIRIKVPVKLLKAGISLSGLLPREVRDRVQAALKEKGIDVDVFALRGADAEEIVSALADLEVDIGKTGERVRIFVVDGDGDGDDDDEDHDAGATRPAEGPGGEETVERTIRRRRIRRHSEFSFGGVLGRSVFAIAQVMVTFVGFVLTAIVWLVWLAWRIATAPFRLVARVFRALLAPWRHNRVLSMRGRGYPA